MANTNDLNVASNCGEINVEPGIWITSIKNKNSFHGRVIFIMGIPVPQKTVFILGYDSAVYL